MPTSGRFLLDTNIVIALFAGEPAVLDRLSAATEVFVPSIVLGELYFGARKSARAAENLQRIDQFAARSSILDCTATTASHYGDIKDALRRKGRPIPENDIWIAALARQHDLVLVTRDQHLHEVDGLSLQTW